MIAQRPVSIGVGDAFGSSGAGQLLATKGSGPS